MNIARILYPVNVLGPGNRIGIWLCGCRRACPGCSNPELWNRQPQYEISVDDVIDLIYKVFDRHPVDGFTISGGEPFEQSGDLLRLLNRIQNISKDILIYTGFTFHELRASADENIAAILQLAAVIIDGPYIESRNDASPLRGSNNQGVHILQEQYRKLYADYMRSGGNQIQNFSTRDGIVSVGIHHKGFTRHSQR